MSIKLTKMYTIRYTQGPNNYFTQSLRHFVGVDMDLRVWRRLNSGGRCVQSPRSWWARRRQPSRTLDQKSLQDHFAAVRLHVRKNRKSVRRFLIFTALSCTPCISSVQFIYHLPVIKNFDLFLSERGLHRLSKHHVLYHWVWTTTKGQSVQQIDFAKIATRMNPWFRAKKCSKTEYFAVESMQ